MLFRKPINIFPISEKRNLYVYTKGIQLKQILEHGDVTQLKFDKLFQENAPGTKILQKYIDVTLDYQELHLALDIMKDLIKLGNLDKNILNDPSKQAQFISKEFRCLCSTAQMKGVSRLKHPIKSRLYRISKLTE